MESDIKCGEEMEWLHSEVKSVKDKKSNTGKWNECSEIKIIEFPGEWVVHERSQ